MFKKFRGSQTGLSGLQKPKQPTSYKKSFYQQKKLQQTKKSATYCQKFRKKNNLSPHIPQLQIIQAQSFIFQGRLASVVEGGVGNPERQKHGEGVMFLKNGYLIIGIWDHGLLTGRSLVFSPFGGKTTAGFYNGKLHGWSITKFGEKLIVCAKYYNNTMCKERIIFEMTEQMWVISRYSQKTNTFQIIHIQKGKFTQLPDFIGIIDSKEIHQLSILYQQFIEHDSACMEEIKQIRETTVSQELEYIGYCNEEGIPNGMGAIYAKNQFYLGHFREGSLECIGRMIFENGEIYHGQVLNGIFYGQGVYYNPVKNVSSIMSTKREEQKVLEQHQGYICINVPMNYFKYSENNQTGLVGEPLNNFSQILEKYYSRYYLQKRTFAEEVKQNSEFGVSQNNEDQHDLIVSESPNKAYPDPKREEESPRRWINFKEEESKNFQRSSYGQLSRQEEDYRYQRIYSLDKRDAVNIRKHLAQQSSPNYEDASLQRQVGRLALDRNLSQGNKKSFEPRIKQNIQPEDMYLRKGWIGQKRIEPQMLTFRNEAESKRLGDRKYSHVIEPDKTLSPSESVMSDFSQKIEGVIKKTDSKRKKIFM